MPISKYIGSMGLAEIVKENLVKPVIKKVVDKSKKFLGYSIEPKKKNINNIGSKGNFIYNCDSVDRIIGDLGVDIGNRTCLLLQSNEYIYSDCSDFEKIFKFNKDIGFYENIIVSGFNNKNEWIINWKDTFIITLKNFERTKTFNLAKFIFMMNKCKDSGQKMQNVYINKKDPQKIQCTLCYIEMEIYNFNRVEKIQDYLNSQINELVEIINNSWKFVTDCDNPY